jgi:multidrug resistance efflux pump
MNRPLFRNEAVSAIRETLSTSVLDGRICAATGYVVLVGVVSVAVAATMLVQVSLGVTATGFLRPSTRSIPIIAERQGVLAETISERAPVEVTAGQIVAQIRNLDLVTQRNRPNVEYTTGELKARRSQILRRMDTLTANAVKRRDETATLESTLRDLSSQVAGLSPIFEKEVERYAAEISEKIPLLEKGLMRGAELENAQRLLTEREVQLRENRIRLADLERQWSQVRAEHLEAEEVTEREFFSLNADLSEIELALQTESEIAVAQIRTWNSGRLMPRGFAAGQTIEAGETLFNLIGSDDTYKVEVDVPATQFGEIEEGLPVKISISAYPYFEYGFFDGVVETLSRIPNTEIRLEDDLPADTKFRLVVKPVVTSFNQYQEGKSLVPGMNAAVHIRREKVAFWRMLLAPMLRFQSRLSV